MYTKRGVLVVYGRSRSPSPLILSLAEIFLESGKRKEPQAQCGDDLWRGLKRRETALDTFFTRMEHLEYLQTMERKQ